MRSATEAFEILDTISNSVQYNRWIYNTIKDYLFGNVLDVGSGLGTIAHLFSTNSSVGKIILSDKSEEMISHLEGKFSQLDNYNIMKLDIENASREEVRAIDSIDTVVVNNVLEHIKDDSKALQNMHRILRGKGRLILITPAISCIYGTLDRLSEHYRRYSKNQLNKKIKDAKLFIYKQYYMNFFGIITWFLAGKVIRQNKFDRKTCGILDRCVPFLEKIEECFAPPLGQSLITVCGIPNA